MRRNNIPEKWIDKRFDELQGDENYLKQIEEIKDWDFQNPVSITLLSSKNGVGKTHIAVCLYRKYVYKYVMKHQQDIFKGSYNYFVKESHIYRRIQDTFSKDAYEKEKDVIVEYANKNFLVIDDLFSSRDNDFARRVMLEIIDARIDWQNKPTVITSNLSLEEIAKIDSRIASRLTNGWVINFQNAKSYRGF